MKIKKGDKIKITVGKDKGKGGVVEKIYKNYNRVLVTGVNLYKRHVKKNEKMPQGGIVEIPLVAYIPNHCWVLNKPWNIMTLVNFIILMTSILVD